MGFDIRSMLEHMGYVAWGVVICLTIMSIYSIGVMIERWWTYRQAIAQSKNYAGDVLRFLKAGKIKALVINGARRSSLMPTVPTFLESGYKGFEQYGWIGALFPAGVAPDRVALMSSEMSRIIKLPHMQQRLRELNLGPLG